MPEITNPELAEQLAREIAIRKQAEAEAAAHKQRADAIQTALSDSLKELASASDGEEIQAAAKRFLFSLPGFERRVSIQGSDDSGRIPA